MVDPCITVNVLAPAYIRSTLIEISPTTYVEPCEIHVTVTWENAGDILSEEFVPGIRVNSEDPITRPATTLEGLQTISHSFTISNLMKGSYTIYTIPPGTDPKTIEVVEQSVMEAGLSEKEKVVMLGLYIGLAFKAIQKWNDMSKTPTQLILIPGPKKVSRSNITNN